MQGQALKVHPALGDIARVGGCILPMQLGAADGQRPLSGQEGHQARTIRLCLGQPKTPEANVAIGLSGQRDLQAFRSQLRKDRLAGPNGHEAAQAKVGSELISLDQKLTLGRAKADSLHFDGGDEKVSPVG